MFLPGNLDHQLLIGHEVRCLVEVVLSVSLLKVVFGRVERLKRPQLDDLNHVSNSFLTDEPYHFALVAIPSHLLGIVETSEKA